MRTVRTFKECCLCVENGVPVLLFSFGILLVQNFWKKFLGSDEGDEL